MPARRIYCADALEWLRSGQCPSPCAVVTSPPDASELKMPIPAYENWYSNAIRMCMLCAGPQAPVVVYATDRKANGAWLSKPGLILAVAKAHGWQLLWHKIVLRRGVGQTDLHQPGYSHLLAIGGKEVRPGKATPDVIERGYMLYADAMGFIAARLAVEYAGQTGLPIVDPFCGRGTVPAIAEALGLAAIGVDIDPDQCAFARRVKIRA